MGHKEKKKHRHRSRSRETESYSHRKEKYRSESSRTEDKRHRRDSPSESESRSRSRSRSRDRKKSKRKHRSRSRDRHRRRHRDEETESSNSDSSSSRTKRMKSSKLPELDMESIKEDARMSKSVTVWERVKSGNEETDSSNSDISPSHTKRIKSPKLPGLDMESIKEDARKKKEILKAIETPEEKRARRLAKKEMKERKRKEKMGWDAETLGYSNADNPFGDEHLTDTFVWNKKIEKEGKETLATDEIQHMTKKKMEENRRELEKVKKRRMEREREREEREREREQLQRDKEAEYYMEWEKSEDSFHLKQAKLRSEIRIKDGRAKPIDLLAKYISAEDDELAIEMHEPYTYLYGLTITDLEDLLEDIKVYLELEQGKNEEYWRDIVTVTEDELAKLKRLDSSSREFHDRRVGINDAVNDEVVTVFKGKTYSQLQLLEQQMRKKLDGGDGVDVGYWELLLQQLKAHTAKTRLQERHQEELRRKLFKLKAEQGIASDPMFPSGMLRSGTPDSGRGSGRGTPVPRQGTPTIQTDSKLLKEETEPTAGTSGAQEDQADVDQDEPILTEADLMEEEEEEEEEEDPHVLEYIAGSYSPKLFSPGDIDDLEAVIYDPADDMKKLELARKQVKSYGVVRLDGETEFEKKAREGMNNDEAQFSVEFQIDQQSFMWSDKYRPRKPRFFNRVHTGFEWNKYNQTHYDIDNPPPKIVQGYKFNIFYPDLIDKSQTPEYTITPIPDNPDFGVLRFHAGPPYEDIAFKIVNKEWEHSYKRGFRCQFANNIMQLWFHFKRYRYRR